MEFFLDPSVWAGLLTLVVLEIVLGIDNLVFIAILSDKLPPNKRDKACLIGLSLALIMRLTLLSFISWMATLKHPLLSINNFCFSGRDLILLSGGLFLLFKATTELHDRLENPNSFYKGDRTYAGFWSIVIQIVALDALFSLDAVITAVGMVNYLPIMMTAVVISIGIMLVASRPLMNFVNSHQTVVVLCLGFLLIIGFSLVAEGFGFHIPKAYLYVAIGFSILIEFFNQIAHCNLIRYQERKPMRERTAEAILRLIGSCQSQKTVFKEEVSLSDTQNSQTPFKEEERYMISGVLTLGSRSLKSIMTPRKEVSWINIEHSLDQIRTQLLDTPHSLFPVCRGKLDKIIGVVRAKELLMAIEHGIDIEILASATPPIIVSETLDSINLLGVLRRAKGSFVIVSNDFGIFQGLITPLDVLEAIAGEFPDEDETPDVVSDGDGWIVKGSANLHTLQQILNHHDLLDFSGTYTSLGSLLIAKKGKRLCVNDVIDLPPLHFKIIEVSDYSVDLIKITKDLENH